MAAYFIVFQSDEALLKARERLEFGKEMMLIPRNLAGEYDMLLLAHAGHMLVTWPPPACRQGDREEGECDPRDPGEVQSAQCEGCGRC